MSDCLKKVTTILAMVISLAACGGGESEQIIAAVPVVQTTAVEITPVTKSVPDVTVTQVETVVSVTPGESFKVLRLKVDCPTYDGGMYCKKTTSLGEVGFSSELPLTNIKLYQNGSEIPSYTSHEGDLYRIIPSTWWSVWRVGMIEVEATLATDAKPGAKATVLAHLATASFDKELLVQNTIGEITVLAVDFHAPVVIANASAAQVIENDTTGLVGKFDATCGVWVWAGCTLQSFQVNLGGAMVGSQFSVLINDVIYYQGYVNEGYSVFFVYPQLIIGANQTVTVKVFANINSGFVYFNNIQTLSGGMVIKPLLDTDCEKSVRPEIGCKG